MLLKRRTLRPLSLTLTCRNSLSKRERQRAEAASTLQPPKLKYVMGDLYLVLDRASRNSLAGAPYLEEFSFSASLGFGLMLELW